MPSFESTDFRIQIIDKFVHLYKNLTVWKKSIELVEQIYKLTSLLPQSETFSLISQMQRAAVSIPSNVAEGSKRNHTAEFIQFLSIANGSAAELETQLELTKRLYPQLTQQVNESLKLLEEILKMLYALINNIKKK